MSSRALDPFRPPSGMGLSELVRQALAEDIGTGDVSAAIFSPKEWGHGQIIAKEDGVLSGCEVVEEVFRQLYKKSAVIWKQKNGQAFHSGDTLAVISAPLPALLQGERTALNFLQRLCAVATLSRKFTEEIRHLSDRKIRPRIYDTRKTTPLLRALEKQAVANGGSSNHRFALFDMAMLKNNHLDAAGGIPAAVERLAATGFFARMPRLPLCVEARSQSEALIALAHRADIIMLDNMTPGQIEKTVGLLANESKKLKRKRPQIEISGGITLRNLHRYAKLPVDRISVGALTHSAGSLDIALHYQKLR
jgi:nicotinate-nucleotide pyrophosphorylase (carboxylating)